MDLAIATCKQLPEPDPDQAPFMDALAARGIDAPLLAWDDPAVAWDDVPRVLIRSTWNYPDAPDAFIAWAERLGSRLVNPPAIIRWNVHKGYLGQLAADGLDVVPTELVPRGSPLTLSSVLADTGWTRVVAKPAISVGSMLTRKQSPDDVDDAWFAECLRTRDMLVQPYVASVDDYGERSLVWIDGEVTHAIRKNPRFAGGVENVSTSSVDVAVDERAFAHDAIARAIRLTGARPRYARIDQARDADGKPMLMELELIEPSLFFRQGPAALARLVDVARTSW